MDCQKSSQQTWVSGELIQKQLVKNLGAFPKNTRKQFLFPCLPLSLHYKLEESQESKVDRHPFSINPACSPRAVGEGSQEEEARKAGLPVGVAVPEN